MYFQRYKITAATIAVFIILLFLYLTNNNKDAFIDELELNTNDKSTNYERFFAIKDFHYTLKASKCRNHSSIKALFIVTSYFGNVETRSAMRRAFSDDDLTQLQFKRVFLLGLAPADKYTKQISVENESKRFGDIVQGNFIEAYRNLTYKHLMGLKWAADNCFNAEFVIKMDDDVVVNMEKVPVLLDTFTPLTNRLFIAGYVLRNMVAIREPANKWYVTRKEYSPAVYPTFVSGWFYVTNPKTAGKLHKLSQTTEYFWIDDTYITGVLAQKLKVKHFDISRYYTEHSEYVECCLDDIRNRNLNCDVLIGPNGGNNNLFYEFNNAIGICNLRLCKNRTRPLNETCVAKKFIPLGRGMSQIRSYKLH
ncbi:unnamed protein product [Phyllotreta striolata]|uniref:Hexosyltransferase n=1 Tax=Phyllotreta striolata TaxID=444603 RepID=A0A9N9TY17_PHYSR|nr:unnamed protein product [Phyllotreta striolata]